MEGCKGFVGLPWEKGEGREKARRGEGRGASWWRSAIVIRRRNTELQCREPRNPEHQIEGYKNK